MTKMLWENQKTEGRTRSVLETALNLPSILVHKHRRNRCQRCGTFPIYTNPVLMENAFPGIRLLQT